jgi:multisubunit Na+/H+ antiporter MnhF subunit
MEPRILIKSAIAIIGQILLGLLLSVQIIRVIARHSVQDAIIALVVLTICVFGIKALHNWRKKN